jgi:hypothetical protein
LGYVHQEYNVDGSEKSRTTVNAKNDSDPKEGLKVAVKPDGELAMNTGASHKTSIAFDQLKIWGGLLIAAGVALMIARAYLPVIPIGASVLCLGVGVVMLVMDKIAAAFSTLMLIGLIVGGLACVFVPGLLDNLFKVGETKKAKQPKPPVTT